MFNAENLSQIVSFIDKEVDNTTFLNYLERGEWQNISSQDFVCKVNALRTYLHNAGVQKGTSVAIISDSSPFWLIVDFALQSLGAVSVPIFANISSENLTYEIEDAEIKYMYIASQLKYDQLASHLSQMHLVITKDVNASGEKYVSLEDTFTTEPVDIGVSIAEDDLATIIYTSGSTGKPKGVELSHKNLITQIKDTQKCIELREGFKALSFLPLAHIFERMVMTYYISSGISIYFADDVKNVGNLLKEIKPNIMTVVPRLLDKIYIKMHEGVRTASGIKKLIGTMAFRRADSKDANANETSWLDGIYKKLVYSKLVDALGGNLDYLVTGGAPLSKQVYHFFVNIGIPLYQGYGLTETSPVICVNTPYANKVGTCGKPFEHVEAKLEEDGELLVKGDSVMLGYHKRPKKTKETINSDGWLYTGDLATIDDEGFITILSRKKELFKTSTGKYVSAIAMEQKITASKWIDYAVVIANNRPFVTALIFMDEVLMEEFAQKYDLQTWSYGELIGHKKIQNIVEKSIKEVNSHLNEWEKIQKYHIVGSQVSIESGVLTPSMKVSREKVETLYQDVIENFYGSRL